jgi:hypothetical protein
MYQTDNSGSASDPLLDLQLHQQSFKPASLPAGLNSHTHLLLRSCQRTIEPFRLFAMGQSLFLQLSCVGIHGSDPLKHRVKNRLLRVVINFDDGTYDFHIHEIYLLRPPLP